MSNNPFQPNPSNLGYETAPIQMGPVKQKVLAASIGLMVAGGVNACYSLYGVAMNIFYIIFAEQQRAMQQEQFDEAIRQNPQLAEFFEGLMTVSSAMSGPVGLIYNLVAVAIAGFIIFGGWKMMNLQSYGIALAASIVAVIPCLSSCCFVGLPIGIWCIVVLSDAQVKNAFRT